MKNFNSFIHAGYYRLLLLLMVFFYINQTNGQRLIGGEFTYSNSDEIITFMSPPIHYIFQTSMQV